ncbi:unnamed protein product [Closterium sp. NIES-54]
MMEKFFSFMSFYEQHQQAALAQSNNSDNNNGVTPMSLDGFGGWRVCVASPAPPPPSSPTAAAVAEGGGCVGVYGVVLGGWSVSRARLMAKGIHLEADSTTQEFKLYNGKGGLYIGKAVLKNNVFVLGFVPDQGTADSDAIVNFTTWSHPPDLDPDFSPGGFWYSHTIPEAERTKALAVIQQTTAAASTSAPAETTAAAATPTEAEATTTAPAPIASSSSAPTPITNTTPTPTQELTPAPHEVHRSTNITASFYSNSDLCRRSPGHRADESLWPQSAALTYPALPVAPPCPSRPRSYAEAITRGDLAALPTWLHWVVSCRYPVEPSAPSLRSPPGASRVASHTLRTTLVALGFAPSTTDPSLFLRTDTLPLLFYVLVYVDDLEFANADSEALTLVKSELQKRHTCTDLGEVLQRFGFRYSSPQSTPLPTVHSLSAPPSDVSLEPSGLYPELVGCLMVLRYLCSTSGIGIVLGGRGPVVLTGHADASRVNDLAALRSSQGYTFSLGSGSVSKQSTRSSSVLSSSCEAEIYAGAMAAWELRWLNYLLTDLGERPCSSPVVYVDNKAMIALCQEHRLEHRMKHIALRYFLTRELQQRGQLHLAYVATQANTADIFTKALQYGDHRRFCTILGLVPTLPHLLTV